MVTIVRKKEEAESYLTEETIAVVIDTCFYSTTVLEALSLGISSIISSPNGDHIQRRKNLLVGGDTNRDFLNRPQSVHGKLGKNPPSIIGLTSDNGAVCANMVSKKAKATYIGTLNNISTIANQLEEYSADNITLFCAGSKGDIAIEDIYSANKIKRKISEKEEATEIEEQEVLNTLHKNSHFSETDIQIAMEIDRSNILPIITREENNIFRVTCQG